MTRILGNQKHGLGRWGGGVYVHIFRGVFFKVVSGIWSWDFEISKSVSLFSRLPSYGNGNGNGGPE